MYICLYSIEVCGCGSALCQSAKMLRTLGSTFLSMSFAVWNMNLQGTGSGFGADPNPYPQPKTLNPEP